VGLRLLSALWADEIDAIVRMPRRRQLILNIIFMGAPLFESFVQAPSVTYGASAIFRANGLIASVPYGCWLIRVVQLQLAAE